ncbi:4-amino-4-deoxy-L-arabinose-phosphoundecaprenol flippase subunit ArnE [subsurface metagenome]
MLKYLILSVIAMIAAAGQSLLKTGLGKQPVSVSSFIDLSRLLLRLATNPAIVLAVVLYTFGFTLYIFLLSRMSLSHLYPVSSAFSFISVAVVAWLILREPISLLRILGIGIIILGMYIVEFS